MGFINHLFYSAEKSVARHPLIVFFFCIAISLILSLGFLKLSIVSDAQELWVAADSRGNVEQNYFTQNFGFFFRVNQFIIKAKNAKDSQVDLFEKPYLEAGYLLQSRIEDYSFEYKNQTFNYTDFCYKPITGKTCLITSPLEYWLMNLTDMWSDVNIKETAQCVRARYPDHNTCFDRIGVPIYKNVLTLLGGIW
jgi:Niemann-Pick C1 protein